jgi:exonuclease III
MEAFKIATLNINGMSSSTKLRMLADCLGRQDVDVIFLQEVTTTEVGQIRGYAAYHNVGTTMRGTEITTRSTLLFTKITAPPSGRVMAANLGDLRMVNIYAPSGTARKAEREAFFNGELTNLLRHATGPILLGVDFNCTIEPLETTGHAQPCRALTNLLDGLGMQDKWKQNPNRSVYNHYSASGANRIDRIYNRIDRIYPSCDFMGNKVGSDILPVVFPDHCAVVISVNMSAVNRWRGTKTLANEPSSVERGGPVHPTVRAVGNLEERQKVLPTCTYVVGTVCKSTTKNGDTTL